MRAARRVALALAALAVFSSIAIPVIDHHYAERLPYHGHVYLAGGLVFHTHVVSYKHAHNVAAGNTSGVKSVISKQEDDSQTASAYSASEAHGTLTLDSVLFDAKRLPEEAARPDSADVRPLDQPPKARL